jgi:molybdenum cofactor cytidylyltransferase
MTHLPRAFAIVPAAGHSVRMGRPKLLLPLDGRPVIAHTLAAWLHSRVERVLVVVRQDDEPLAGAVKSLVSDRVALVRPDTPPADMKGSVRAALTQIERDFKPFAEDAILVAPADMPRLAAAVIEALLDHREPWPASCLVPTIQGRRGHPVLLPWPIAREAFSLLAEEGLDALLRRHAPVEVPCDELAPSAEAFADLDNPEQYRRLAGE